ncbi:bacterial regulatory helix-turn-helix, lysR family protein [Paraburkholderia fungorum]|uniref:Bacterial regulatory helix-turn-helix, lysR family protein n=1 Tax=Paraburkholderia fungorum TaxID=134537 RepID=A0AAU8TBZ4_9BURK|nr:LysR family transcriptional regulator [Paraburkholderia fungorum]AJZ59123.1 bacterial regulatory helix-turn-helix, lysR family protein [Paraburkholderia fungorum]USU17577.1 LysR substrate-binding domain-containing protein [Paraburkholderia fungorum]USU25521.1 LysR substrate-binding domain-containing protein [Paraburkholderia fungorum]
MDRFLSIEAFVRVAEASSFAEAARQLGVTSSVVTNRIQQLEKFVNAPLFHRSTRHVRLSEVGEAFYRECAEVVGRVNELTDQMRELRATPTGRLRIQMLPGFALGHFGIPMAEFNRRYPGIQLDVIVNDRVVDPIEEGFDIAFQIFPAISESLIERRLFTVRRLFCAAPAYIAEHGAPQHPRDLLQHTTALYSGYPSRNRWTLTRGEDVVEMELPGMIRSNSVHLLRDYALTGGGVVCLPTLVASASLLDGSLVPILTEYQLSHLSFAAVYPATQRQALKVKALVEFLVEYLGPEPAWDLPLLERGWVC